MAISGDRLFVANWGTYTVGAYTTSGTTINASLISSLADETPEGRSVVDLARKMGYASESSPTGAEMIPFTAETRMSGIRIDGHLVSHHEVI